MLHASAQPLTWLSLGAKEPRNTILESSGIDTADASAKARIEPEDAHEHCSNFVPSNVAACAENLLQSESGRVYTAEADCLAGKITTVNGESYRFAGYWQGDWGTGRSMWRDSSDQIVRHDNASGGLGISQHWEVLCPSAKPTAELVFTPGGGHGIVGIEHNNSLMWHDNRNGVLYYEKPKQSLNGTISAGTVIFVGDPWSFDTTNTMAGTAYTFRKGCEPAPYPVTGHFMIAPAPNDKDMIVLRGASPVREKNGCRITGYTTNSSNAELIFTINYGDT